VTVLCVVDAEAESARCAGFPVLSDWESVRALLDGGGIDVVVVTDIRAPQQSFDALCAETAAIGISEDRILAPKLLRIAPAPGPR
jgi:hypothetical protein